MSGFGIRGGLVGLLAGWPANALAADAVSVLESRIIMWVVILALTIVFMTMIANIFWRHRVEVALRLGEARFRAAFETAAHGMALVGTDGSFLQVNNALCEMLGYTEQELVDLNILDITFAEDLPQSRASAQRFLAGDNSPCHFEKRYIHKSGHLVWTLWSTTLVRDSNDRPLYFVSQIKDITERKKAEEELEATRRRLETIIEFLPDATFAIDVEGRVVAWNRAMEELTGVCSETILGQGEYLYGDLLIGRREPLLIDLVMAPNPDLEACYETLEKRGETLFAERFLPRSHNGRGGHFWIKASPLYDRDGSLVGAIESLRDITMRREAEEELKSANRDLDAFVYTVAHDLRAPLTPILGFTQYLQEQCRDRLDEEIMDLLGRIEDQGQRMLARMENLLDLARVGYLERPSQPVRIEPLVERVLGNLASQLEASGITVDCAALPAVAVPDTLLAQLFENLIANALNYAGASSRPVVVGGEHYANGVRYFVRDHGPGIPEEERERVFDTFFRGSSAGQAPGTGIGLATVKKIVRLYNGHVWIEETPGGGCTFWVELPDKMATEGVALPSEKGDEIALDVAS